MSLDTPFQAPYSFCCKGPLRLMCTVCPVFQNYTIFWYNKSFYTQQPQSIIIKISFPSFVFLMSSPDDFILAKIYNLSSHCWFPYSYLQTWPVPRIVLNIFQIIFLCIYEKFMVPFYPLISLFNSAACLFRFSKHIPHSPTLSYLFLPS